MLEREEYVEQAYFFRILGERLPRNMPLQDLLLQVREELLATTRLPMAVDFLRSELIHRGAIAPGMERLSHYFTPFQTYLIREAESERGRFDMRVALEVLRFEAAYRAEGLQQPDGPPRAGVFMYQFETLCRNRLSYDLGLKAISEDPLYDEAWREWISTVRRQVGLVDFADLLFVRSEEYWRRERQRTGAEPSKPLLFGSKEGRIAAANRRKDPLYLFAALQRHLSYPVVPRPKPHDETPQLLTQLMRRLERLETRIKLLEDEQKEQGIDLSKFYNPPDEAGGV